MKLGGIDSAKLIFLAWFLSSKVENMKFQISYQIRVSTLVAILVYLALTIFFVFLFFHVPVSFWTNVLALVDIEVPVISSLDNTIDLFQLWGYQTSLYEVIITTLIGINAVTAILAFVYMHGKAKEEAEEKVKEYLEGAEFEKIWMKKNADFSPELESFEEATRTINQLSNEVDDLQRQIRMLSRKIANMDTSEEELANNTLVGEVKNGLH